MGENSGKKLYYYVENGRKFGPYSYHELVDLPIRQDTLVWCNGMSDWTLAGDVGELDFLFQTTPPPIPEDGSNKYSSKKVQDRLSRNVIKNRRLMAIVLSSFAFIVLVSLFSIIYILKTDTPNPPMPEANSYNSDSTLVTTPLILNTSTAKPVVTLHAANKVNSTSAVVSARIIQGTSSISSETVEYAEAEQKSKKLKFWTQALVREKGRGIGYLGNLKPKTKYKYRVRVKSSAGTVVTDWQTFTTLPKAVDIVYNLSEHNRGFFDWIKACNISGKNRRLVEACDYTNNIVRNRAVHIAGSTPGSLNIGQLCDLFDYCISNWSYVNDAQKGEAIELASNTLQNGLNGDCDDFAVLMASMVMAVGGEARISYVYKGNHGHAFAEVNIGSTDVKDVESYVSTRYSRIYKGNTWYRTDDYGNHWLNLDWWERHPGGRYYESDRGIRFYLIQRYCEEF